MYSLWSFGWYPNLWPSGTSLLSVWWWYVGSHIKQCLKTVASWPWDASFKHNENELVVEPTDLKNMLVKIGNLPQIGVKMTNIWKHHLEKEWQNDKAKIMIMFHQFDTHTRYFQNKKYSPYPTCLTPTHRFQPKNINKSARVIDFLMTPSKFFGSPDANCMRFFSVFLHLVWLWCFFTFTFTWGRRVEKICWKKQRETPPLGSQGWWVDVFLTRLKLKFSLKYMCKSSYMGIKIANYLGIIFPKYGWKWFWKKLETTTTLVI